MFNVRPLKSDSNEEIQLVASRMKFTLIDVMGAEKGSNFYSDDWLLDRVRWHLDLGINAKILLCVDDIGNIVGQAIIRKDLENDCNFAYFSTIYVEPSWRRKGAAKLLIEEVIEWCRSHNFLKITYSTAADNQNLIELLQKYDFMIELEFEGMVKLVRRDELRDSCLTVPTS
jgi:ribosomal protein S18 acetylase RimI-like enzyme